jgi:large subunit ribosomal protein L6
MSRIGNKEITIPADVTVEQSGGRILVNGSMGVLEVPAHDLARIKIDSDKIKVSRINETKLAKSIHGLTRTLIANAIEGVSKGFTKQLEIIGVGYRAAVDGKELTLKVGYSHDVKIVARDGITFEVKKNIISVSGIDKQLVGQMAAEIRKVRKPEPYKGKGIKYVGEKIIRKVGKAVKGAGA